MAKDYTKYTCRRRRFKLEYKARLVQKIVEHHASSFEGTYQAFLETWFDDLQGGKGVCKALTEIDAKNERNYYVKEPITLSDGTKIAVCNQWGKENFPNFLATCRNFRIYHYFPNKYHNRKSKGIASG